MHFQSNHKLQSYGTGRTCTSWLYISTFLTVIYLLTYTYFNNISSLQNFTNNLLGKNILNTCSTNLNQRSRDSSVGIATSYGLDDWWVGVWVLVGSIIFSSPCRPNRLWGPPNLLSNGYWGLSPRGLRGRGVKLTTHLQQMPRSRKCGYIYPLPHTPSWHSA
jgi:hypothetical protein